MLTMEFLINCHVLKHWLLVCLLQDLKIRLLLSWKNSSGDLISLLLIRNALLITLYQIIVINSNHKQICISSRLNNKDKLIKIGITEMIYLLILLMKNNKIIDLYIFIILLSSLLLYIKYYQ
jgi:hypothetical protein